MSTRRTFVAPSLPNRPVPRKPWKDRPPVRQPKKPRLTA
jgi:hypothetical protein